MFVPLSARLLLVAALCSCARLGEVAVVSSPADAQSAADAPGAGCHPCVTTQECGTGRCVQGYSDTYCAVPCAADGACPDQQVCIAAKTSDGQAVQVCVAPTATCGGDTRPHQCGVLRAPEVLSCCTCAGGKCAANGCYGGWWCAADTCLCQAAPSPAQCGEIPKPSCGDAPDAVSCCKSCGGGGNCQANGCYGGWFCDPDSCQCHAPGSGAGCAGSAVPTVAPDISAGGTVLLAADGKLTELAFAIVGDTRPAFKDATNLYPTPIITQIWKDIAGITPPLDFAVTTGDYVFAGPDGVQASLQLDLYLGARSAFAGPVYAALGNHECTGYTASNCGIGSSDGVTGTYASFVNKMVKPLGVSTPWYRVRYAAKDGSWTAKVVVIAANAWSKSQQAWLEAALAEPTTYTFVVRHEGSYAMQAPGVGPSEAVLQHFPVTMLIAGHTHTYEHKFGAREVIVGNGGAPLSSAVENGFVVVRRQPDATIRFTALAMKSLSVMDDFAVHADGSPAP